MANKLKGEIDWQVEDHTYVLRLSLDDILSLQTELGIPTLKWQKLMAEREIGMREANAILVKALRRGDPDKFQGTGSQAKIKTIMEAAGFMSCLNASMEVLLEGLSDPVDRKKRHEQESNGKDPDVETPLP